LKVILINRQKEIKLDISLLKKISTYVADKFDANKSAELNIIFVGRREISELNQSYRQVQGPTDVLSFSYKNTDSTENAHAGLADEDFRKNHGFYIVGEVIISPEIAAENIMNNHSTSERAKPYGTEGKWDLNSEIALLIIHGILHLYGYDHLKEEDHEKMENIQSSLLNDVRKNYLC